MSAPPRRRSPSRGILVATAFLALTAGCPRDDGSLPPAEPGPKAGETSTPVDAIAESPAPVSEAEPIASADALAVDPEDTGPPPPWRIALEPDAAALAAPLPAADPGQYSTWKQRARIRVGESHLATAFLSFDERHLIAMSDAEATVRVYDARTRALKGNHAVPGFSPGDWARGAIAPWPGTARGPAFVVGNTRGLFLLSSSTGQRLAEFHPDPVWDLRWSPDATVLVASTADIDTQTSLLRFFRRDGDELLEVAAIPTPERIDEIALSRDLRRAAVVTYPSTKLRYIDLTTGRTVWEVDAPQYAGTVDIAPDGSAVAVGGAAVLLVDADDPSKVARYDKLGNNVDHVRFSPSGDALAVSAYDGHARVLSTDLSGPQMNLLADFRHGGTANVYAVSWRADGQALITSSGDRTIRQWGP